MVLVGDGMALAGWFNGRLGRLRALCINERLPRDIGALERGVHSVRGKSEPLMLYSLRPADPSLSDGHLQHPLDSSEL